MKECINKCECLEKMGIIGFVKEYDGNIPLSIYADINTEEGTLCYVTTESVDYEYIEDDGELYHNYRVEERLFPIHNCPLCGKKIDYLVNYNLINKKHTND